jgi:hypothetical protein
VTVFTRSGDAAQRFVAEVEVGMVGVNFPLPTPVGYYSHGGWKNSAFGDLNQYGEDSIRFFTRTKNVTQRWPHGASGVGWRGYSEQAIDAVGGELGVPAVAADAFYGPSA